MKPNTCVVLDVWEGQLEIDEPVLKANGVAGIGIRLNDMSGGHHMDIGFVKQWAEAKNFVRFPYFVYNPWVSGTANFNWLVANMPAEVKTFAVDIEVRYSGITSQKYADEVRTFLALCRNRGLRTIIYTAQWFLTSLAYWPNADYWWAQYPDPTTYFSGVDTWDKLKVALDRLDKPFNINYIPGTLKMWQFGGDYLTLPGTLRKIDVNIFYGTEQELAAYFQNTGEIVIPPINSTGVKIKGIYNGANLVPQLLTVNYSVDGTPYTQMIDQRPSGTNPPVTGNFYRVASEKWPITHAPLLVPPGGGPLTQTMSHTPKKAYEETPLNTFWQSYIKRWNSDVGWKKIAAIDYGPSKGINSNGMLRYIGLVYPSNSSTNNKVKVLEIYGEWARIESIPIDGSADLTKYSPTLTPWLFHKVCDNKGNPLIQNIICPILGGPWWVSLQALVKL